MAWRPPCLFYAAPPASAYLQDAPHWGWCSISSGRQINRGGSALLADQRGGCNSVARERTSYDHALNVACAFVYLRHAHIAINALHWEIAEVAVAAVDLDRIRTHFF